MVDLSELNDIRSELNGFFLERREEIDICLTAILSKKHVLMLGPAGTAKSMLARAVASHFGQDSEGWEFFEYLLTKFTTPEEIFGPLDYSKLKGDPEKGVPSQYKRITDHKLPKANFAFLDEIFKASSSINNTLLPLLNERIFYNPDKQDVPLISMFCASNELPEPEEGLDALYDRIHLRKYFRPLSDHDNKRKLWGRGDPSKKRRDYTPTTAIPFKRLSHLQDMVPNVDTSAVIEEGLQILDKVNSEGIYVSDRKWNEAEYIVQAYALLHGRQQAVHDDLSILQHVFWNDPKDIEKVKSTVLGISNPFRDKAEEFDAVLNDFEDRMDQYTDLSEEGIEQLKKLKGNIKSFETVIEKCKANGRDATPLEEVHDRAVQIHDKFKKQVLGQANL